MRHRLGHFLSVIFLFFLLAYVLPYKFSSYKNTFFFSWFQEIADLKRVLTQSTKEAFHLKSVYILQFSGLKFLQMLVCLWSDFKSTLLIHCLFGTLTFQILFFLYFWLFIWFVLTIFVCIHEMCLNLINIVLALFCITGALLW